jgi:hypothetical protein
MTEESQTAASNDASAGDTGALDRTSVPLLLAEAWRERRSGWLRLSRGKSERRIQIMDGSPTAIESSLEEDDFARTLEDQDLITHADRIKIEKFAHDRKTSQSSAVLALRLLDAKSLYKAIRNSARNQICETFEWQTGDYQWL